MTHTNGYAAMVELFDIQIVYVALNNPDGVDKSLMETRLSNMQASIRRDNQVELQCQPVMMRPAQSIQVFGAMPGKLRLEVIYAHAPRSPPLSLSYSGAYAIHWIHESPATSSLRVPKVVSEVARGVLRERVADLCHQLWSEWTQDLLARGGANVHGTFTLPSEAYAKLTSQLLASYPNISWEDRDAYRAKADKFLECILVSGDPSG